MKLATDVKAGFEAHIHNKTSSNATPSNPNQPYSLPSHLVFLLFFVGEIQEKREFYVVHLHITYIQSFFWGRTRKHTQKKKHDPSLAKPNQTKPNQTKPNQTKPNQKNTIGLKLKKKKKLKAKSKSNNNKKKMHQRVLSYLKSRNLGCSVRPFHSQTQNTTRSSFSRSHSFIPSAAASASASASASAAAPVAVLPDLPYAYGDLAPVISGKIMELHHGKHHQGYVNNYNTAVKQYAEAEAKGDIARMVHLQVIAGVIARDDRHWVWD